MPHLEKRPEDHSGDRDISLVDLAAILVIRWKSLMTAFLLVLAFFLAYAVLAPDKYVYSSLYSLALQAPNDNNPSGYLDSPEAVREKINNVYFPQALRDTVPVGEIKDYSVSVIIPDDAGMIMIVTEADESRSDKVSELHATILDMVLNDQQRRVVDRQNDLEERVAQVRENIEQAKARDMDGFYRYVSLLADLENDLSQVESGQVIQTAQKSIVPSGLSRVSIILLGVVLSGMLGIIAAFLVDFSCRVKRSLKNSISANQ